MYMAHVTANSLTNRSQNLWGQTMTALPLTCACMQSL